MVELSGKSNNLGQGSEPESYLTRCNALPDKARKREMGTEQKLQADEDWSILRLLFLRPLVPRDGI